MPIYEYECQSCGHNTEIFQTLSEKPIQKCPKCGRNKLQKLVSASSFQLKGEGWYVTDYRKDKKPSSPESVKDDTATTTKASGTSDTKSSESKTENSKDKKKKDKSDIAA